MSSPPLSPISRLKLTFSSSQQDSTGWFITVFDEGSKNSVNALGQNVNGQRHSKNPESRNRIRRVESDPITTPPQAPTLFC